jgi:quercetin dioxygenase-like cupin family protein
LKEANLTQPLQLCGKLLTGYIYHLSELTTQQQDNVNFIDSTDILPIKDDNVVVYPYFPYDKSRQFEMFKMEIQPGCESSSEGHHLNSEEFIIVNKGVLTINVNGEIYNIDETQALRFNSDIAHTYQNNTDDLITFTATIYYQ